MKGFGRWKNVDGLERRLRDDRPVPPEELVHDVVSRIEGSRHVSPTRVTFRRLGLAGVAAATMLIVLGAFGGVGFAASGVSDATSSTVDAIVTLVKPVQVKPVQVSQEQVTAEQKPAPGAASTASGTASQGASQAVNRDDDDGDDCDRDDDSVSAAREEYCPPRRTICHNGHRTLTLPARAAARHLLNHQRDHRGPCRRDDDDD